jgi:hypothetical protein
VATILVAHPALALVSGTVFQDRSWVLFAVGTAAILATCVYAGLSKTLC